MNNHILRQFFVIFTTIFTLVMNGAANAIPLNGRGPEKYQTVSKCCSFRLDMYLPSGD